MANRYILQTPGDMVIGHGYLQHAGKGAELPTGPSDQSPVEMELSRLRDCIIMLENELKALEVKFAPACTPGDPEKEANHPTGAPTPMRSALADRIVDASGRIRALARDVAALTSRCEL